jgi:hypothetical protein
MDERFSLKKLHSPFRTAVPDTADSHQPGRQSPRSAIDSPAPCRYGNGKRTGSNVSCQQYLSKKTAGFFFIFRKPKTIKTQKKPNKDIEKNTLFFKTSHFAE